MDLARRNELSGGENKIEQVKSAGSAIVSLSATLSADATLLIVVLLSATLFIITCQISQYTLRFFLSISW